LEHTTQCADLVVTCRYIFAYYICVFKKKHFFYLSVSIELFIHRGEFRDVRWPVSGHTSGKMNIDVACCRNVTGS